MNNGKIRLDWLIEKVRLDWIIKSKVKFNHVQLSWFNSVKVGL